MDPADLRAQLLAAALAGCAANPELALQSPHALAERAEAMTKRAFGELMDWRTDYMLALGKKPLNDAPRSASM